MKTQKAFIMFIVCFLVVTSGASAFAEDWGYYKCTITKAGPAGNDFRALLNCTKIRGASTAETIHQWFEFHPYVTDDAAKVMTATILCALSTGSKVEALVYPGTMKSLWVLYLLPN
jgi:hypothetical protein